VCWKACRDMERTSTALQEGALSRSTPHLVLPALTSLCKTQGSMETGHRRPLTPPHKPILPTELESQLCSRKILLPPQQGSAQHGYTGR